jgi:3-oxoacyl-[acyl-carrier protein] reductase
MSKLAGKVAVVTGASKGIGAGIAKALAAEGASVVVNYASSKDGADAVVDAIVSTGGKAVAWTCW